ncbi:MAG TPA: ATP-binding cassette domain-containing protein [Edaphobacter sp.]|jgi:molybdate transport system ATP-binding protein|nr:ATP-binding cassette domain-containing protein [Edaphobacter sp.]
MKHTVGAISLDVNFALKEPWTVLFGPSGSGKTTVLRAIAGFVRPNEGLIVRGPQILVDYKAGIFLPAFRRPVRTAGQIARLFPHRTVRQNVSYGTGWNSKPDDVREVVDEVMELFRLSAVAERKPRDLSGGERQRVSVARAVASAVMADCAQRALLLLDEPFSGLDNVMRDELLAKLREWLKRWKTPVLSVTHDVGEAFQLGAEVIKIAGGRVVQQGPVGEVLAEERARLLEQLNAAKKSPA